MKIIFKASAKIELEVKKEKNPRRTSNDSSWIKKILKYFSLIIVEYLFTEFILKRLVALIINIFTNGSFYFYNRMFYFGEQYG